MKLPKHVAIIMDGNGRWAQARKHNRLFGHLRGARAAKDIIEYSCSLGIENLTLFAFSAENWNRPKTEISFLMKLLHRQLRKERFNLIKNNIKFHCLGNVNKLPKEVQSEVIQTIQETNHCTGMNLVFALSYGGRQEITLAMQKIAEKVSRGEIKPEEITENLISNKIESAFLPNPDLIIRTSGESRLSNFFLWQAAYSEIMIHPKMWPDFDTNDFFQCLNKFKTINRRFGRTQEQVNVENTL